MMMKPDVYGIDHANAEHMHTPAYALTRDHATLWTWFLKRVLSSFQAICHRF